MRLGEFNRVFILPCRLDLAHALRDALQLALRQTLALLCFRRHDEPRAAQVGQVGLRVVALRPNHQCVDLEQHRVLFEQLQERGQQRGLAVVAGPERNEDSLLLRRAGHGIAQRALQVLHHAIGALQVGLGGVRVAAHDAAEEAQKERAFGLRFVVVVYKLGQILFLVMRLQLAGPQIERAVEEVE